MKRLLLSCFLLGLVALPTRVALGQAASATTLVGTVTDSSGAAVPNAKFVILNLPFKQIAVKKLTVKKKTVMAIYAEESGADRMTSATFWDGKKYRYQPIGSSME